MTIFTDSATISTKTTPSAADIQAVVETSTLSTVTVVSANERGPFTDLATTKSTTTITVGEYDYVHPAGSWGSFDTDNGFI